MLLKADHEDGRPMSDYEIRDELMTLLLAGHETTASALALAVERIVRHPDVHARLAEESRTDDHEYVDAVVTVDDAQIARAALWLFHEAKQVVEPSGAATVAAVLWPAADSPLADKSAKVVAILSGGNVAPSTLAALAEPIV